MQSLFHLTVLLFWSGVNAKNVVFCVIPLVPIVVAGFANEEGRAVDAFESQSTNIFIAYVTFPLIVGFLLFVRWRWSVFDDVFSSWNRLVGRCIVPVEALHATILFVSSSIRIIAAAHRVAAANLLD